MGILERFCLDGRLADGPYGAARAGVMQMTETLAVELAPRKIRVKPIAPGVVVTEMLLGQTIIVSGGQ